jgi:trehalose synthase
MKLADYAPIAGRSILEELKLLGAALKGKIIQNINSTFTGGGVAEILSRMVPLLEQLGVDARWNIIQGNESFFRVTKKFHNALHGRREEISPADFDLFREVTQKNLAAMELNGDVLFIHDPQPCGLILHKSPNDQKKWIWRCHIDISQANEDVWNFLRPFVAQYDAAVFSAPAFARQLPLRQFLIAPSIDPLSDKNKELSRAFIEATFADFGIPLDKPIITQVSRFDYLKDPVGVIQAFEIVRKSIDCRLVFAGGAASDDPEANQVLAEVKERAGGHPDIYILHDPPISDIKINALQRGSTIILQKSLGEGFGLTVSEALWKAKPVVASAVGGIPLQVKDKLTGLLSHGIEGTAFALRELLSNPDYARWLGNNGREHVKNNFLITRHLKDYLILFLTLYYKEAVIDLLQKHE